MRVKGFLLDVEGTLVMDKAYQPVREPWISFTGFARPTCRFV